MTNTSDRTIRTLQIGMSWFPEQAGSGLDRMYHGLIEHLPEAGVRVRGLVAGSPDVASSSAGTVRAFASDESSLSQRLFGVRRSASDLLQSESLDLAAMHFALYALPLLRLADGVPWVVHFHGPWGRESRVEGQSALMAQAKTWIERAVYRRGTAFVVLSKAFRNVLVREFDVDAERIHIVPGGVNTEDFDTGLSRREARERLGWSPDRPTIVAVRRLARRMGLENLVRAMQEVQRRVPDVRLYIAGKGPLEPELREQIDALDLNNHVELLGFVPDPELPLVYRSADVSIVPTIALEGFGLVTVESLASGTPVFVTPHGGLPEVVSDLDPDLLLPGDTPPILADSLIQALSGRHSLPSPQRCQDYVRNRFDWSVIARQTRRVYEDALS